MTKTDRIDTAAVYSLIVAAINMVIMFILLAINWKPQYDALHVICFVLMAFQAALLTSFITLLTISNNLKIKEEMTE